MANDPRTAKATLLSFDNQMVTIVAGSSKQEFHTHRASLENSSAYFRAAFKEEWKEGQDREITLGDVDPDHLHRYLHFLYTSKIACQAEGHSPFTAPAEGSGAAIFPQREEAISDDSSSDSSTSDVFPSYEASFAIDSDIERSLDEASGEKAVASEHLCIHAEEAVDSEDLCTDTEEYELLVKLYVFGERFQDSCFRNAIVDAIVAKVNDRDGTGTTYYPMTGTINIIYEGTLKASPARRLMVNIITTRGLHEWLHDDINTDFYSTWPGPSPRSM